MNTLLIVMQIGASALAIALVIRLMYLNVADRYRWFSAFLLTDATRDLIFRSEFFANRPWMHSGLWAATSPFLWIALAGAVIEAMQRAYAYLKPRAAGCRVLPWLLPAGCLLLLPLADLISAEIFERGQIGQTIRGINATVCITGAIVLLSQRLWLQYVGARVAYGVARHQWALILLLACGSLARIAPMLRPNIGEKLLEFAALKDTILVIIFLLVRIKKKEEPVLVQPTKIPRAIGAHAG